MYPTGARYQSRDPLTRWARFVVHEPALQRTAIVEECRGVSWLVPERPYTAFLSALYCTNFLHQHCCLRAERRQLRALGQDVSNLANHLATGQESCDFVLRPQLFALASYPCSHAPSGAVNGYWFPRKSGGGEKAGTKYAMWVGSRAGDSPAKRTLDAAYRVRQWFVVTKPLCDHVKQNWVDTKFCRHFSADLRRRQQALSLAITRCDNSAWSAVTELSPRTVNSCSPFSRSAPGLGQPFTAAMARMSSALGLNQSGPISRRPKNFSKLPFTIAWFQPEDSNRLSR